MRRIGIGGGIGSGKSTLEAMIRQSGLPVLDADAVVRDLLEPGSPLLAVVVDAFGAAVLTPSGVYDRQFVARVIFSDESARRRLNSIIHPAVGRRLREFLDEQNPDVTAAFVAIPLLSPEHRVQLGLDEVWVLEVSPDEALRRLVAGRNMSEEDARARLRAQLDNEARRTLADVVLDNSGPPEHLRAQLEELLGRGV
jgi:dephospho-CoA kinase